MASRKFENKMYHLNPGHMGLVQLFGKVQLDAGADTAAVSGKGFQAVGDGSTGEYEVTLDDKYAGLHCAQFSMETDPAADAKVVLKSETVSADGKFVFVYMEGGSPAQPTAANVVHMFLALEN